MKVCLLGAAAAAALTIGLSPAQAAGPAAAANLTAHSYGTWGVDLGGRDTAIKPGDDFYQYANGDYVAKLQIPGDQSSYGNFMVLRDLSEARVRNILETAAQTAPVQPAANDIQGKVGAFYKAFMNEKAVEAKGARPLAHDLAKIKAVKDKHALAVLMGAAPKSLQGSLFDVGISADNKDPNRYAVYLDQGGLGLPDRDYYLQPTFAAKKAAYQAYVARMLSLIRWPQPAANAKAIVEFETKVAQAQWSRAEERDPDKTYNPMTPAELVAAAPGFDWKAFLTSADLGSTPRVVVGAKSAVPKIAAIYEATPLATLKAYQAFHLADGAAADLSKTFVDAHFEFWGRTISGQTELPARWKRGVRTVSANFGEAIGRVYVAKYFPPEAKAKMEDLVANLKAAYHQRIENLAWMSPETKAKALEKLANFDVQVGYPKKWKDYSTLKIRSDDLIGDLERSTAWEWNYRLERLNKPVDKDEWVMSPQTVNAYNMPNFNEVVFPAAILQPPFFDPKADPAVNYGAIGAVIGHEMSHGFDDEGRKFDAHGRLADWWTPQDAERFEAASKSLGAEYEAFPILPNAHINGQLTMGENIADLGGVLAAYDAYHASLHGQPAPVIDGLTGDQRFFLAFAQVWRSKMREDMRRRLLVSDPHSPEKARVDVVLPNVDAWYTAFNVQPGDKMYLPPEKRVRIW